jgi:hypothetical protein
MLSAVPSYLSMADFGMVYTAGTRMTMAIGRSDAAEPNRVFQSAQLFMMIVCGSLTVLLTPLVLLGPLPNYISLDQRIPLAALKGHIVPIRDADALAERLQHLAHHPVQRAEMAQRALAKVKSLGGCISTVRKTCRFSPQFPTPWTVPDARLWAEIKLG